MSLILVCTSDTTGDGAEQVRNRHGSRRQIPLGRRQRGRADPAQQGHGCRPEDRKDPWCLSAGDLAGILPRGDIADEAERMAILDRCWTDGGVYADPYALVEGRSALSNQIAGFHRNRPGHRIPLASGVEAHHGYVRFQWVMLDATGQKVGGGFDVGELAPDGRLERITGFFGPFPEIPAGWPEDEVWGAS